MQACAARIIRDISAQRAAPVRLLVTATVPINQPWRDSSIFCCVITCQGSHPSFQQTRPKHRSDERIQFAISGSLRPTNASGSDQNPEKKKFNTKISALNRCGTHEQCKSLIVQRAPRAAQLRWASRLHRKTLEERMWFSRLVFSASVTPSKKMNQKKVCALESSFATSRRSRLPPPSTSVSCRPFVPLVSFVNSSLFLSLFQGKKRRAHSYCVVSFSKNISHVRASAE